MAYETQVKESFNLAHAAGENGQLFLLTAGCSVFQGIIHRDIKSENILLAGDGTVKLADFGLSINHLQERPVTRAGTLDMMAPEVISWLSGSVTSFPREGG